MTTDRDIRAWIKATVPQADDAAKVRWLADVSAQLGHLLLVFKDVTLPSNAQSAARYREQSRAVVKAWDSFEKALSEHTVWRSRQLGLVTESDPRFKQAGVHFNAMRAVVDEFRKPRPKARPQRPARFRNILFAHYARGIELRLGVPLQTAAEITASIAALHGVKVSAPSIRQKVRNARGDPSAMTVYTGLTVICENCGTEFHMDIGHCPACGRALR
jgi:hypothetical protein